MFKKDYLFKINSNNIDDKKLEEIKELFQLNGIEYGFETVIDNDIDNQEITEQDKVIYFYTNGYVDNFVEFNNILDIQRFNEVYYTIKPMYSFNYGFDLIENYSGKDINKEIITYCKKLYYEK